MHYVIIIVLYWQFCLDSLYLQISSLSMPSFISVLNWVFFFFFLRYILEVQFVKSSSCKFTLFVFNPYSWKAKDPILRSLEILFNAFEFPMLPFSNLQEI